MQLCKRLGTVPWGDPIIISTGILYFTRRLEIFVPGVQIFRDKTSDLITTGQGVKGQRNRKAGLVVTVASVRTHLVPGMFTTKNGEVALVYLYCCGGCKYTCFM